MNLIEVLLSANPPPVAAATVVTVTLLKFWISAALLNTVASFGVLALHFLYVASIILPFIKGLPSTPSPNCNSYLPPSAGTM